MADEKLKTTEQLDKYSVNKEIFDKVRIIQGLPDDIVLEFLKCKGELRSTNFKLRVLGDE